jgi:2-phospho-L-lactate transferase/gluconeogenesis factor (CofD/UPF0052 family)/uncharacterized protein with ATP-grasp and redox domains
MSILSGIGIDMTEQKHHSMTEDDRERPSMSDGNGLPQGETQSAKLNHYDGSWHTAVVVLMFTEWGEVVLQRFDDDSLPDPGRWKIPDEHLSPETDPDNCVLEMLGRQFQFIPDPSRLEPLPPGDRIAEDSQFPSLGLFHREYKVLYSYALSWEEYCSLQNLRIRLPRQSLGGELASIQAIRFVGIRQLLEEIETKPANYTSGTLTVFRHAHASECIVSFWADLAHKKRQVILDRVAEASDRKSGDRMDDSAILDAVNPRPETPAAEFEVQKVLFEGKATCPGAYYIGEMLDTAGHLENWARKLSDPYQRYVEEDIDSLRQGAATVELRGQINQIDQKSACRFVRDVLHFPLENGMLLRNQMGNLEEIAASRNALKLYLRTQTELQLPDELIDNPQRVFNEACNRHVRDVWKERESQFDGLDDPAIHRLLKLNVLLNALDFHTPDFHDSWAQEEKIRDLVESQFDKVDSAQFDVSLGGDAFVEEFSKRWLSTEKDTPVRMVYFVDNNGQLVASLKCVEAFLQRHSKLTVVLVPKDGQHGNDASCADVYHLLEVDAKNTLSIFDQLRRFRDSKRLIICEQGPQAQGLNARHLSQELCHYLNEADVILTEGQAYAEIRGWRKPTYMLFQVKGRVAEAIHGVSKSEKALAFVRVGGGVYHFSGLKRLPNRVLDDSELSGSAVHIWGQTTSDYVKAILSDNYRILRDHIFNGKEELLLRQLREEAARTDKSVAQIVLGTEIPSLQDVCRFNSCPTQVFAVGGGGGFNQVTLKALSVLGLSVTAGVPSTDDGGSTGKLQAMLEPDYGYMFGVGDAAAILEQQVTIEAKRPILSFRPGNDAKSLTDVLVEQIIKEAAHPTIPEQQITDCPDFLAFVCEQLNLARVIDKHFLAPDGVEGFSIQGASIRNLNILAAFYLCGAIDRKLAHLNSGSATDEDNAERAWYLLQKAYGLFPENGKGIRTVPVTYDRACLWATYSEPLWDIKIKDKPIPREAMSEDGMTVYGQQYIDQIIPNGKIVDFGLVNRIGSEEEASAKPCRAYLDALRSSKLFIMGAGSLYGSQLAQLAVPGVIDELVKKDNGRKVLVLNHVCMNETTSYSLTDHIKAVERLANSVAQVQTKEGCGGEIRVGDIFTDIVVPRTVS